MSNSFTVAHIADTHLGYRKFDKTETITGRNIRSYDFAQALTRAVTISINAGADLFVHAGDIFDRPKPDMADCEYVAAQIYRLSAAGIPQVWIAGNHDMSWQRSSALTLLDTALGKSSGKRRVHIAAQRRVELVNGLKLGGSKVDVIALPWGWSASAGSCQDTGALRLVVAHGDVTQVGKDVLIKDVAPEPVPMPLARYYFLGHQHVELGPQGDSQWQYAGSTERSGWRDYYAEPAVHLVTFDKDEAFPIWSVATRRVPIATRQMLDLGEFYCVNQSEREKVYDLVKQALGNAVPHRRMLSEAIIRLTLIGAAPGLSNLVRDDVKRLCGTDLVQVDRMELSTIRRAPTQVKIEPVDTLDLTRLFADFVSELSDDLDGFKERFRERGEQALKEAAELVEQEGD